MPIGAAGQKKTLMRCAGLLRRLWPLPIRKNPIAASGPTIVGRKGTCGMASIMARRARAAPREVQDPGMIGRIPVVLVPRVSIQTARIPTVPNQTDRTQSILPRTVRIQTDHIQIVHAPTGHTLTVPGQRSRDSTARQERVGERGVQVRTIEGFSLLRAVVLLIAEALVAQRNRIASL